MVDFKILPHDYDSIIFVTLDRAISEFGYVLCVEANVLELALLYNLLLDVFPAAARLGLGPKPDDFYWTEAGALDGRPERSLSATRRLVSDGVAGMGESPNSGPRGASRLGLPGCSTRTPGVGLELLLVPRVGLCPVTCWGRSRGCGHLGGPRST